MKSRKLISDAHDASKMDRLQGKSHEKLPHGIMQRVHNPPLLESLGLVCNALARGILAARRNCPSRKVLL